MVWLLGGDAIAGNRGRLRRLVAAPPRCYALRPATSAAPRVSPSRHPAASGLALAPIPTRREGWVVR